MGESGRIVQRVLGFVERIEREKTDSNSNSKIDKRKGVEYKTEATIAAALHNLASCMLQNNKPKEAYENYRTSLNLKQLVFENENHPEIALTLHHMAEALLLLERVEDAIVVLERSVKITGLRLASGTHKRSFAECEGCVNCMK